MGFCPEDAGAAETLELLERKTEEEGEVPCYPPSHPPISCHCIHCISLVQLPWNCRTQLSFQQGRGGKSQGLDRWLWAHLGPTYSLYFQLYTDLNSPDVEKCERIVSYKQCYKTKAVDIPLAHRILAPSVREREYYFMELRFYCHMLFEYYFNAIKGLNKHC